MGRGRERGRGEGGSVSIDLYYPPLCGGHSLQTLEPLLSKSCLQAGEFIVLYTHGGGGGGGGNRGSSWCINNPHICPNKRMKKWNPIPTKC